MVIAAGIAAVGSVAGAVIGSNAASSAAKKQAQSAQNALNYQKQQSAQTRADLLPYNTGGQSIFGQYQSLLGAGPKGAAGIQSTLENLPGYQFTRDQGLLATQNNATSSGLGVSGNALRAAAGYATGLANSTYGTYANQLYQGAALGENAAAQAGNLGQMGAQNVGNQYINQGNAQAGGIIGSANALSNGLNGLSSYALMAGLQNGGLGNLFGGGSPGGGVYGKG